MEDKGGFLLDDKGGLKEHILKEHIYVVVYVILFLM